LRGLDKLITTETGVPTFIAEQPLDCVALGVGKYFDYIKGVDSSKTIYDSLNG
jgi:rod shape-determining protein MreB